MTPDKSKLINALLAEYEFLCHDDFDPDEDPTLQEYHKMLIEMSYDDLIEEASLDEEYTLEDYLGTWS